MKANLECDQCEVHYQVKWTHMAHDHGDPEHPLEDDDDSRMELSPSICPFCGHAANEVES
jgi:hypothetical protein